MIFAKKNTCADVVFGLGSLVFAALAYSVISTSTHHEWPDTQSFAGHGEVQTVFIICYQSGYIWTFRSNNSSCSTTPSARCNSTLTTFWPWSLTSFWPGPRAGEPRLRQPRREPPPFPFPNSTELVGLTSPARIATTSFKLRCSSSRHRSSTRSCNSSTSGTPGTARRTAKCTFCRRAAAKRPWSSSTRRPTRDPQPCASCAIPRCRCRGSRSRTLPGT